MLRCVRWQTEIRPSLQAARSNISRVSHSHSVMFSDIGCPRFELLDTPIIILSLFTSMCESSLSGFIHSFIHSFWTYIAPLQETTTQRRSQPSHGQKRRTSERCKIW